MNFVSVNNLTSSDYKHYFLIKTPYMKTAEWSEGVYAGGSYRYSHGETNIDGSILYYSFKTVNNPSGIGEITIENGIPKVTRMMRNRAIPDNIEIIDYKNMPLHTDDEKHFIVKMSNFHFYLKRICGYGVDYIHITPTPLYVSKYGKTINVEYLTTNFFDIDDFINYRTDKIRISDLTIEEINNLENILHKQNF